ncbi:MAG: M28 family peptidase [Candidatus Neomarinimicrobiota bacterium]
MRTDKRRFFLFVFIIGVIAASEKDTHEISSEEILDHIKYLASDDLEGRRAGTRGARKAARYITRQFRSYGLTPMGRSRYTFMEPFDFISGVRLGRKNRLLFQSGDETMNLNVANDFRPLGFSGKGHTAGQLAFVGYGIDSEELDYHDYASVDVKGKIVLILRYSPDGTNPHGEFGKYSPLRYKAMTAREQGAVAVIFAIGPEDDDEENYLMGLKYDRSSGDSGIPIVAITQRLAKHIFTLSGRNLGEIQKRINDDRSPDSFDLSFSVEVETWVEKVHNETVNIVGLVEGTDTDFSDEFLVVGAHYDHLGMGGDGSMVPDTVAVHNGADDNASGTAGLLELAEWFSVHPQKRSIIFVAFGGEELGLLGSAFFVSDPPVLLQRIGAMINMDMIGRMDDSTVVVGGAGTSTVWKELAGEKIGDLGLSPAFDEPGYGSSDHQSFYLKDIPVLFFFSGTHDDYHRPSDDWDKINAEEEEKIVRAIREIIIDLATRKLRPDFVKVEQGQPTRGGFPVYIGTIPDYTATDVKGMKLSGVRKGGPADQGGLKAGDIIVRFGEKNVRNIYDFMYALQEAIAGDSVTIVVSREGNEINLQVVPARRRD